MTTVIKVENLGKKYTISHQTREEYSSLRDALTSCFSSFRSKLSPTFLHRSIGPSPLTLDPAIEDFWALKDVSFEVKQGERLGIIGRNGAGKSTLLKLLSRITDPTTGSIRIKGRVASLLEVGTGFHPELTGRENIYLNGAILGMGRHEIKRKFDEIVAFSEIERFLDTPVKRYSSGMYVRLAFAVAAHLDPEILIVDEVLAVGDAQFQKKCLGKMEDVGNDGRTVMFVSHNMQAIKTLCSRGILLDKGKIAESGVAADIVDTYLASGVRSDEITDFLPEMHRIYPPDLEILRMEIINRHGEQTSTLLMAESFSLRLRYRINAAGCGYRIGIVFSGTDQTKIATVITTGGTRPHLHGECGESYSISVRIGNIFRDGRYYLSLHVKNSLEKSIDVIDGLSFTVLPVFAENIESFGDGFVRLESQWTNPVQVED